MMVVMIVPVMHQHVAERAKQKQRVRQNAQNVGAVLLPEEEQCDRQEYTHGRPEWQAKRAFH
jgi:hypothetical protein